MLLTRLADGLLGSPVKALHFSPAVCACVFRSKAYRQDLPRGEHESPGCIKRERIVASILIECARESERCDELALRVVSRECSAPLRLKHPLDEKR
jgi:hypothetical protein